MTAALKVVVNGASARIGGGLTYLLEVAPRLAEELHAGGAEMHLVVSDEVAPVLVPRLAGGPAVVHRPAWAGLPGIARVASEQVRLPLLYRSLGAAAVFHVGDIISLVGGAPNVVLCRNRLLYSEVATRRWRVVALRRLAALSLRRASAVVFVSQTLAGEVSARFRIRRSEVIHHGPGLTVPFKPRAGGPEARFIVVGSIYDYKRIELAIDTVAELRGRGVAASLDIVGRPVETEYVGTLHDQVRRLGLDHAVRFSGEASAADVAAAYEDATVALVTSTNESFCHPILEAFSAGLPLVVGRDLPVADEIAGQAALLTEPTPGAFADAVTSLLDDPALYRRLVRAGAERVGEFSWSKTAAQTAALILSVAGGQER